MVKGMLKNPRPRSGLTGVLLEMLFSKISQSTTQEFVWRLKLIFFFFFLLLVRK